MGSVHTAVGFEHLFFAPEVFGVGCGSAILRGLDLGPALCLVSFQLCHDSVHRKRGCTASPCCRSDNPPHEIETLKYVSYGEEYMREAGRSQHHAGRCMSDQPAALSIGGGHWHTQSCLTTSGIQQSHESEVNRTNVARPPTVLSKMDRQPPPLCSCTTVAHPNHCPTASAGCGRIITN